MPIFLPIRSFGDLMPFLVLMNTKPWRKRRCRNTGMAVIAMPLVPRDDVGRTGRLGHVEMALAQKAPVPRSRVHVGQDGEVDAVGLDRVRPAENERSRSCRRPASEGCSWAQYHLTCSSMTTARTSCSIIFHIRSG